MERVQETAGRRNVTGGFSAGAKKSLPVIIGMVPSAMAFGILMVVVLLNTLLNRITRGEFSI